MISRLGTGKPLTFFTVQIAYPASYIRHLIRVPITPYLKDSSSNIRMDI
jgi:hypothetical protein